MNLRQLPFTLYPKKSKTLLHLLLCALFVAGGVWMIRDGERMGWLVAGFFGLALPVFLLQLLPGSSFLTVRADGIEFCSMFRRCALRWSDISEFGVYSLRNHGLSVAKMVGFNYSSSYQRAFKARAVSKALAGFEGGLPDTYGLRADDLAQLLSAYHMEQTSTCNELHAIRERFQQGIEKGSRPAGK